MTPSGQQAARVEACLALRAAGWLQEMAPEYPQASYYRARYYDQGVGRFLNEDTTRFAGGQNFYRYVANNPVSRKDPLGLWQFTIGGGMGLGAELTFGMNNGQWNFGLGSGVGQGLFLEYDPKDTDGCHKFYAGGETTAHGGIGLGGYA